MESIKNWKDLEFEIGLFDKCKYNSKNNLSVGQILNCLSQEIEASISYDAVREENFYAKFRSRRKFKKFKTEETWDPKWNFPELPKTHLETNALESILQLKTAMTAFRLHSGPFSNHPEFGGLDKLEWEMIHLRVARHLLGLIHLDGREKFNKQFHKKFSGKKKYYNNRNKKNKNQSKG